MYAYLVHLVLSAGITKPNLICMLCNVFEAS